MLATPEANKQTRHSEMEQNQIKPNKSAHSYLHYAQENKIVFISI